MLPINYSLRNLARRRLRALLTILGIAVVVALIGVLNAFQRGIVGTLADGANENNVYLISLGAESEIERSAINRGQAEEAANDAPGVYEDENGRYASIEVFQVPPAVQLPESEQFTGEYTAVLRGVTSRAFLFHDSVFITEGREPRGDNEMIVGELAPARMGVSPKALAIGNTVRIEGTDWRIVGHFVAPGSQVEAELWVHLEDMMVASRLEEVTLVALRLTSPEQKDHLDLYTSERRTLEMTMLAETDYFAQLLAVMNPIAMMAQLLAVLVLIGGVVGCANTVYANALSRTQEMAVLQTIGYRRREVIGGLTIESILIALLAGFAGVAISSAVGGVVLRMPMGAISIRTGPEDVLVGLGAAAVIGLVGAMVPSWRVYRQSVLDGLKDADPPSLLLKVRGLLRRNKDANG